MDKIVLFDQKSECCGCGACMNVCPKKAIHMQEDEYGFVYPCIDETLCIGCGACKRVCGYQNFKETNVPLDVYVSCTTCTDIKESASGGVFASLAKKYIEQGGVVYGASMEVEDGKLFPKHICVDSQETLIKLQGSKYVQSAIGDTYSQVKKDLKEGKKVLFSGTPCQVAGLKAYLGNTEQDDLLLVDIICHGVPSVRFFQEYLKHLEAKWNGQILHFKFRDKSTGWGLVGKINYLDKKGKERSRLVYARESSYYQLFLQGDIYRENCYSCKYANSNRPGDITLGDYWGIEREHPELLTANGGCFDESKGVSCTIVNTEKGREYIEELAEAILKKGSSFDKASKQNGQLRHPTPFSEKRQYVLDMFKQHGYEKVDQWFMKSRGIKLIVAYVIDRIPVSFKKKIRRILK